MLAALVVAPMSLGLAAPVFADNDPAPPFIDHVKWVHYGDLSSLRVFPTQSGRAAAGQLGKPRGQGDEAWGEVLALAPDADIPGLRAQFICHWRLAEFGYPGKTSWNLEPWRPVVDENTMIVEGCNPGGSEEPF